MPRRRPSQAGRQRGACRWAVLAGTIFAACLAINAPASAARTSEQLRTGAPGAVTVPTGPTGVTTTPVPPSTGSTTASAAVPNGQISWGIAPADNTNGSGRPHFDYTLSPGASVSDALVISNHSDHPITLRVYAADAFTTADGGIDVLAAGQKSKDAGTWITVKTPTIAVTKGKTVTVPFTLRVPANATPGDHPAGIVSSLVETNGASGVTIDHRLGSRIYLRVSGAVVPSLGVTDVHTEFHGTANPFAPGSATVTYTVHNTGNIRLSGRDTVAVAGPWGMLTSTAPDSTVPEILPGDSLVRTATVSGVWPAFSMTTTVSVHPTDDAGHAVATASTAVASASFVAIPWSHLVVLLLIVGLIIGYLVLRHRRKKKTTAAIDAAVAAALAQRDAGVVTAAVGVVTSPRPGPSGQSSPAGQPSQSGASSTAHASSDDSAPPDASARNVPRA